MFVVSGRSLSRTFSPHRGCPKRTIMKSATHGGRWRIGTSSFQTTALSLISRWALSTLFDLKVSSQRSLWSQGELSALSLISRWALITLFDLKVSSQHSLWSQGNLFFYSSISQYGISQLQIFRSDLHVVAKINHCSRCGQLSWQKLPTFYDDITAIEKNLHICVNIDTKWVGYSLF